MSARHGPPESNRELGTLEDTFEPPKYLASLISAINDGAKSAQTSALAFTLIGLYLLATAFSTTDEDMLLQRTMTVSQIGVQVPVVFSFAIAPAVFLFLHVYTLIRYDMLAANLRQFRADLASVSLEADRERCRQLLANVEFVQTRTAPKGSPLYSLLYRFIILLMLGGFPVATLLAVQVSSLRYQSDVVTKTQQACAALDLALLVWLFYWHRRRGLGDPSRLGWLQNWPACVPLAILAMNLFYLNVPFVISLSDLREQTVRAGDDGAVWHEAYRQPLDLVLCPTLHWGCRYLTVDHRTLVGHVWNQQSVADLRAGESDATKHLAAIEGVFLRNRSLLFAKFDESRLYGADFIYAVLQEATFFRTQLQAANLQSANLSGAILEQADLSGAVLSLANLSYARLGEANLTKANLVMADLSYARLDEANLTKANLSHARLNGAHLSGADLSGADLSGALLGEANLTKANLTLSQLVEASLSGTNLTKANLSGANLSGALLGEANLSGALLGEANLRGGWPNSDRPISGKSA